MPFQRKNLTTLIQEAQQDVADGGMPGVGVPVPGGFLDKLTKYLAGLIYEVYTYVDWVAKQCVPWTATDEYLHGWAQFRGVTRKDATQAVGNITIYGTANATVNAGTIVTRNDGVQYVINGNVTIGNTGVATATITSVDYGLAVNAPIGTTLNLATPVLNVQNKTIAATEITGALDQEDDDSFRSRMLLKYQEAPQGGSIRDYEQWALAVPGVTRAWCNPHGQGLGTVEVYPMFDVLRADRAGFPLGNSGVASSEMRSNVKATGDLVVVADYIYPLRPATAIVHVRAPQRANVNVVISGLSVDSAATRNAINVAIDNKLVEVGTALGGYVYPSDIFDAIKSVSDVEHFSLSSPTAPVVIPLGNIAARGSTTFTV